MQQKKGYEKADAKNDKLCTDIDECTDNLHDCSSDAFCNNTVASYTCTCHEGKSFKKF